MSTTNDTFFDQIISAKAALDAQPRLEAEIATYKSMMEAADKAIQSLNLDLDSRATVTNDLQKRIAELEAGLNESRKSEADTGARLSLLMDTLRDITGNISVALNVIEPPKPEPITTVAEVVSVPSDPTFGAVQNAEAPTSSSTASATDWRSERDAVITPAVWPTNIAKEAVEESNSPFAATTASPLVPATSTAQTSWGVPHAEPSDGASLRDILHHAYTRS